MLSGTLSFFGVWSGQQKQGCEDKEEAEAELSLLWGPVALGFGTGTDLFLPPVVATIFILNLLAAISNQYAPVFDNEATGGRPGVEAGVEESLACNRVDTVELIEWGALQAGDGGEGGGHHRHQDKKQQHVPVYFARGSLIKLSKVFTVVIRISVLITTITGFEPTSFAFPLCVFCDFDKNPPNSPNQTVLPALV